MYQGDLPARLGSRHIVARLDVHGEAAHDTEHAGARCKNHRHENVELVRLDGDDAQRIGVEDKTGIDPASDQQRQRELDGDQLRPVLEPRVEQDGEKDDRKQEEQSRQPIGDRRVHDAGRHQKVEKQDHRKGQHQIGQKRQDRVDPAAIVAGRQAERDADHQREGGRGRRDDQHDLAAEHHAAEHIAGELVATEEIRLAGRRVDRTRQCVLHDRHLRQRIERARSLKQRSP